MFLDLWEKLGCTAKKKRDSHNMLCFDSVGERLMFYLETLSLRVGLKTKIITKRAKHCLIGYFRACEERLVSRVDSESRDDPRQR